MGIRINRAIGYGMPWRDFVTRCKLPENEQGVGEALWERFRVLKPADLTITDDDFKRIFYVDRPRPPPVVERDLLAEDFTSYGKPAQRHGDPCALYQIVDLEDRDPNAVLFFPNMHYAKQWYRYDDHLDYAFEQWRDSVKDDKDALTTADPRKQAGPRGFIVWPRYGFYPLGNSLMLADGTPVEWDHFTRVEQHPEWLPAVPSEIRWYLQKLGILDEASVNKLRPVLAQWWG